MFKLCADVLEERRGKGVGRPSKSEQKHPHCDPTKTLCFTLKYPRCHPNKTFRFIVKQPQHDPTKTFCFIGPFVPAMILSSLGKKRVASSDMS
jgi:hypothetical protein